MKDSLVGIREYFDKYLIAITILLGAIFQVLFLFVHDMKDLIVNTIPDDGFYYLQIARNIVEGCGSTMDCMNATNGYHPLWMMFLVPIFKLFSVGGVNDTVPIYMALFASICFVTVSAVYLYKTLRYFTANELVISFALLTYLFNPYILYNTLNGLETGVLLFVLSVFLHRSVVFAERSTLKNAFWFGLVGGVLVLARLDMVFVVAVSLLYVWFKSNFKNFLYSVLGSQIFFLPWLVYNYTTFNMFFTSASRTSTYINHHLTYSDNGGYSIGLFVKTIIYMLDRAMYQMLSNTGAFILILPLIGLFVFFVVNNWKKEDVKNISPLVFILAGNLLLVFISAGLRWTFRSWYFMPLMIFVAIMVALVVDELRRREFNTKNLGGILIILFAVFFYINYQKELKDAQVLQAQMYDVTLWQNDNLPEGSHIGVFNAGIQTYFSKHKVTNLDGLVNNNASNAMLNGYLWKYITETEHIDYISDFDSYMTYRYKDSFGTSTEALYSHLEKVKTFPGPKDLNVYKIRY